MVFLCKKLGSDILIEVKVRDHEITATGHANYAEYGKDIVCASVSMLLQNLIKSIHDLTDDKIEYDLKLDRLLSDTGIYQRNQKL